MAGNRDTRLDQQDRRLAAAKEEIERRLAAPEGNQQWAIRSIIGGGSQGLPSSPRCSSER